MTSGRPAWDEDKPGDLPAIIANIRSLWPTVEADARRRTLPSIDMVLYWHRRIYDGVQVPDRDYVGAFRDSDLTRPCLMDYEVAVGASRGTAARDVPVAVDSFIASLDQVVRALDAATTRGQVPVDPTTVRSIVRLCAYAHGEWIRIHPFANGSGRTARLWANWLAVRYALPAFVRIKPRPADTRFVGASALSMGGDHRATEILFVSMLNDALTQSPRRPHFATRRT
ncbi:MAG: Fic family protein [Candidatus Limnocylindrales bacterium]